LLLGLIALTGATVMLNVANSVALFIVGRLLQGISAAVVWVVGLALLVDTVDQNSLGQYMGYVSLGMSLGIMIAPVLGGVLFDSAGYNAVFALCYAFIAVDLVFRLLLIEKKNAKRWIVRTDTSTIRRRSEENTSEASAVPNTEVDTRAREKDNEGETMRIPPQPESPMLVKPSRLPAFVTLLASRRLLAALLACLMQAVLVTSFDSVLPLFVNETFQWYSQQAGILYLALVIPTLISPLVGHFSDLYGGRWFAVVGFLLAAPVFVLLRLVDHDSLRQKVLLAALLSLIGLALTLAFPPLMAEISYVVVAKEKARPGAYGKGGAYAQAYGLFNMAFAGGTLIGPIWAGFVKNTAGWSTMAWTLGLLSGVTAIPTAVWVGGSIRKKRRHAAVTSAPSP
jgi:MFS family permease